MPKTKNVVKEKVEMPETPATEKQEMPEAPETGKQEMPETPATEEAGLDKKDVENRLNFYMARHHFPNGWKRDIKAIIKPLL